jgi:hypothetical protein
MRDPFADVGTPTRSAALSLLPTASPPDPRFHGIDQYWLARICS